MLSPEYYTALGFSLTCREGRLKSRISHCQPFHLALQGYVSRSKISSLMVLSQFFGAKSTDTELGIYISFTIYSFVHFRRVQKKVFRSQSTNKCQRQKYCWQKLLDRAPPLSSEKLSPVCPPGSQPKTSW